MAITSLFSLRKKLAKRRKNVPRPVDCNNNKASSFDETTVSSNSISINEDDSIYDSNNSSIRVATVLSGRILTLDDDSTPVAIAAGDMIDIKTREMTREERSINSSEPDVYGQVHPNETPELLATSLVAFEEAVAEIPDKKKQALMEAMEKCPDLLDDTFKLLFLRCETFHVTKAAKRYAKYWDKRLEIFGPIKAFQPLTQAGALKDDSKAMSMGYAKMVTGAKDPSGRTIIYLDIANQDLKAYESYSMARSLWYGFHEALKDEETQKKGVIIISDVRATSWSKFDYSLFHVMGLSLQGCLPVRLSGVHSCLPPKVFSVIFPIVKVLMGERLGKRMFVHGGSVENVHKRLATKFGITKAMIPTELGGNAVLDHEGWLASRP